MASPEQPVELLFPTNGLDVTTEYELQQPGTGPVAENVRSIDPITQRSRGASRAGCTRYVDDIPGGTAGLIQHLNIIVDPTVDALAAQLEDFEYDFPDPTNNPSGRPVRNLGRHIRRRGSGRMQRRSVKTKVLATAVSDSVTADLGGAAVSVNVLANDTFDGSPTLSIVTPPIYGRAVVVGRGTSSTIRYTPPTDTSLDIENDSFRYRLRATGNARNYSNLLSTQDVATVEVTFNPIDIAFVQSASAESNTLLTTGTTGTPSTGTPFNLVFAAQPATGNALVVFVTTLSVGDDDLSFNVDTTLTVKNAAGHSYTQVGTYQPAQVGSTRWRTSMWRRVAADGVDEKTVTVTPILTATGDNFASVAHSLAACHEYSNTNASPVEGSSENAFTGAGPFPEAWSTGNISVLGNGRALVAAFRSEAGESSFFTFDTATQRTSQDVTFNTTSGSYGMTLFTGDVLDVSIAVPVTGTDVGGNRYQGAGVSLKK